MVRRLCTLVLALLLGVALLATLAPPHASAASQPTPAQLLAGPRQDEG